MSRASAITASGNGISGVEYTCQNLRAILTPRTSSYLATVSRDLVEVCAGRQASEVPQSPTSAEKNGARQGRWSNKVGQETVELVDMVGMVWRLATRTGSRRRALEDNPTTGRIWQGGAMTAT